MIAEGARRPRLWPAGLLSIGRPRVITHGSPSTKHRDEPSAPMRMAEPGLS